MPTDVEPSRGAALLAAIFKAVAADSGVVQARIDKLRRENPHASPEAVANKHADRICWLHAGQGAATALPGAIPGLGTATQVGVEAGAILTDLGFMLRNQANMSLGVAAAFGHPLDVSSRIDELAVQLGIWSGAVVPAREATKRIATKVALKQFDKIPGKVFMAINRKVGTTVITKYGTKRGGVAIGRLIPFGVGALIGGGVNLAGMKSFKKVAIKFYRDDIPGGEEYALT